MRVGSGWARAGFSPRAPLPIQVQEPWTMLTTTIIFTVLVAAWGRSGTFAERAGFGRQARGGRRATG